MKRSTVPGHSKSTIEGISVDDCAARCISYVPFECRSFDYCADIGLCAISDTHPGDGTVVPTFNQMCDVFSSKYMYLCLKHHYQQKAHAYKEALDLVTYHCRIQKHS